MRASGDLILRPGFHGRALEQSERQL